MLPRVSTNGPVLMTGRTFNTVAEAVNAYQGSQLGQGQSSTPALRDSGVILVRNNSGADRQRFDIVGLASPIFCESGSVPDSAMASFTSQVAFNGVVPTDDHAAKFAVLLEPIAAGSVGRACINGICVANVDVLDADHKFAKSSAGATSCLSSSDSGAAMILWRENVSQGVALAVIRIGNPAGAGTAAIPVKLSASNGNGSYTGKEQTWNGLVWADKSGAQNITAYNLVETTGSGGLSAVDVTDGPIVMATDIGGRHWFERQTNAMYKA